ncbi:MAG: hypothetical protein NVS2B4_07300 [Ramlibacter sp.]
MENQFIRIEPIGAAKVSSILDEADRCQVFCSHVKRPAVPTWKLGSPAVVRERLQQFMDAPCKWTDAKGVVRHRKRRSDFRGLLAGVFSWPMRVSEILSLPDQDKKREIARLQAFADENIRWLEKQYGDKLVALVLHVDEEYPHVHFFVVGDCRETHPGLRAEYEGRVRLSSYTEKIERYKTAMRRWLDDYHAQVGAKHGLTRSYREFSRPRIKDRAVAIRFLEMEKKMQDAEDLKELTRLRQFVVDREQAIDAPRC